MGRRVGVIVVPRFGFRTRAVCLRLMVDMFAKSKGHGIDHVELLARFDMGGISNIIH